MSALAMTDKYSKDGRAFELAFEDVAFAIDSTQAGEAARAASPESGGAEWGRAVIGQPRALEALRMGLRVRAKGYNVYVSGAPGTGRRTAVLRVFAEEPFSPKRFRDIVYVYNFVSPLEPIALDFPAGEGTAFKQDIHRMVEAIKKIIRLQAESSAAHQEELRVSREFEERENGLLTAFESKILADGFKAVQIESGESIAMDIVPMMDGNSQDTDSSVSFDILHAKVASGEMAQEAYDDLRRRWYGHMDEMKKLFGELRKGRIESEAKKEERRARILSPQVSAETSFIVQKWPFPEIRAWVSSLEKDIMTHLFLFAVDESGSVSRRRRGPALARYGANLLVDRGGQVKTPVVLENHPTAANLFGTVEPKPGDEGDTQTAYLRIRAGAFLRASGGFLVLRAEDVLADEEAWLRLKRSLQDGRAEIQSRDSPLGPVGWLKPEAPRADVKVVMIGGESSYDVLYQTDPDFQKLFKVHAEFDSSMPLNAVALRDYAAFARRVSLDEGLLPQDASGLAAVTEQGARLAEYRTRLSTRFGMIADLLRESDYRARLEKKSVVSASDVRAAVEARARLANLPEEKLEDMIASGEIILQASGTAIGRVNGLAIHDRGYYAFGVPAVISAQVSPGEGGVINIEGESGLSGEIYDKAVLIVEGFLRSRYARDFPLAVTASICFEQSYTAVEGDSASSTAVYALLSAIADIPLRQDIAVTGSLNQLGQVQPVGGVNEKIEGFFRVCRHAGLSGTQGVMIPRRNVVNLTLSGEVQEAVAAGTFHIWAVSTIDEGIAVLADMPAGSVDARGDFPPDSFNGRVRRELLRMARTVKSYTG
jgi:lon-related putative ATP-dependent protease